MKNRILALLVAMVLLFTMLPAFADAEQSEVEYFTLGDAVPDFTAELCDGTTVTLSEMLATHEIVMINIWATWCGPCEMEFPYMNEAYDLYSDRVALVCLSAEATDTSDVVAEYKEAHGLTLPMGQDTIGLSYILVQEGYPTTVIIDRFGNYAYYECGSITNVDAFTRMWDYFLSEDYTESVIVESIPGPKPTIENCSSEELTAMLSADQSIVFTNSDNEYDWPFICTELAVVNSNYGVDSTKAVLNFTVSVEEGAVLAIDYSIESEVMADALTVLVNDTLVSMKSGENAGVIGYAFPGAGEYAVSVVYEKDDYTQLECADTVELHSIAICYNEDAAAILEAMPVYPQTLEGSDIQVEILNGQEIVFDDPSGYIEMSFGDAKHYVVTDETALVKVRIGTDYNPEMVLAFGDCDYNYNQMTNAECDEEGFIFETELSTVESGAYSNTYIYVVTDGSSFSEYVLPAVIYANEENVNYFCACDIYDDDYNPVEGVTWTYADGTAPSTDEIAQASEGGYMFCEYTINVVDEDGNAIDGCMINICDDETCQPTVAENGVISFEASPFPYVLHVLTAPEGYEFDSTVEYTMPEEGGEVTIVLTASK